MSRRDRTTVVEAVERVAPDLIRVVVAGEDLADFDAGGFTDAYVKVRFAGGTRSFTVRSFDAAARRLTLDFFVHGDTGVAGPWALRARPGDALDFAGPAGGYAPDPRADWHLLAGDECVLPAIAASLERVPAGVSAVVVAEIGGPGDEIELRTSGDLRVHWVHRDAGATLPDAVRTLALPEGEPQLFVHGEAEAVRAVRRDLLVARGLSPDGCSISGYWKRDRTDEAWRAEKAEWKRLVEADSEVA